MGTQFAYSITTGGLSWGIKFVADGVRFQGTGGEIMQPNATL